MFSKVKNYFIALAISLVFFGFIALIVVNLVMQCIGGAFTIGNFNNNNNTGGGSGNAVVSQGDGGNSLYFLTVISDYRPSYYGDYDFGYIRDKLGASPSKVSPSDVRPVSNSVINLPIKPLPGSLDTSGPTVGVIGGLLPHNERTIHTDVIVLVRMDKESKQFSFTYFPRNSLIEYGGESILLRDIYYYHGLDALVNVVHSITGIRPDRRILIHSEYVDDIIDYMGGINTVVPAAIDVSDPENDIFLSLKAGGSQLDGEAVKDWLLYDSYAADVDFSVERAGMLAVRSVVATLTQPRGYADAGSDFDAISRFFITDMTVKDISDNRDVWYGYSTYQKKQLDIKGRYVTAEDGKVTYQIDMERTLRDFVEYRKHYE